MERAKALAEENGHALAQCPTCQGISPGRAACQLCDGHGMVIEFESRQLSAASYLREGE